MYIIKLWIVGYTHIEIHIVTVCFISNHLTSEWIKILHGVQHKIQ